MTLVNHSDSDATDTPGRLPMVLAGGVAVFLLAFLGVEMTRAAGNVASIWLPNVVALGVLLRVRGSARALSFVLSALGIFGANSVHGDPIGISLGLTIANLLEIALGAIVLIGIGFDRRDIVRPAGFFKFIAIAGVGAPLAGGLAGALVLQELVGAPFLPVFQTWVFSGILGAVIIGPAIIAPVAFAMDRRPLALWETAGWSVTSAAVIWITTTTEFGALVFLLPGLVIAAGIRLGLTASGLVGAVLAVYVAWNIVAGSGNLPFAGDLLAGQIFLLGAAVASHVVAILWHQRIALEAEKENYVRAFRGSSDGILFVDAEDRFVAWNEALIKMAPWIASNIEGGLPAFRGENLKLLNRLRAGESVSDMPLTRPDGDGGSREFLLSASPLTEDGIYQGATVTLRDVTETRLLRQVARQRAAELEAFIDATPDIVIGTDAQGTITVWNRMAEQFHGLSKEEILGTKIFDLAPSEEGRRERQANFQRVMAGETITGLQLQRKRADGEERKLVLSLSPIFDDAGSIVAAIGNHHDITELVDTREESEQLEAHLANAFSAVADGLAIYDAEDRLVRYNDAYLHLIGRTEEDPPLGETWDQIISDNLRRGLIQVPSDEHADWIEERRLRRQGGGDSFVMNMGDGRWHLGNDYPIDGGGVISVRQDITPLKETQEALELSNKELEQFAFVASHDLQEPLRKINSFGSILISDYSDALPEEGQQFVQSMMRSANRMRNLIQDLLTYSRLQKVERASVRCSLNAIVDSVVGNLEVQIAESDAVIDIGDLGEVKGDRTNLERLVQNLVINSLKYRKPDVPLRIEILPAVSRSGSVGLIVRDNGRGFDMRFAEQIMEPFQRLHAQSEIPGTGMGLAIVQKILRACGGTLEVEAVPGEGAEFTVWLSGRTTVR